MCNIFILNFYLYLESEAGRHIESKNNGAITQASKLLLNYKLQQCVSHQGPQK